MREAVGGGGARNERVFFVVFFLSPCEDLDRRGQRASTVGVPGIEGHTEAATVELFERASRQASPTEKNSFPLAAKRVESKKQKAAPRRSDSAEVRRGSLVKILFTSAAASPCFPNLDGLSRNSRTVSTVVHRAPLSPYETRETLKIEPSSGSPPCSVIFAELGIERKNVGGPRLVYR